jgi:ABC-2 type transport system ATP-binding protein
MLTIDNLTFAYEKDLILENLCLNLEPAKIHGIVGLNGSGKTTLLNCIFGSLLRQTGKIEFNGSDLTKKHIGYLETVNYFYPKITGGEYLRLFKTKNRNFNIEKWNDFFVLPLNREVEEYSTGMKKKLAFTAVLCLDKPFMILDEPFNGLDLETNQLLKRILLILKENGKTILLTSHILEVLVSVSDTISYLNNKKIEFTITHESYGELEHRIFSVHQDKTDGILAELLSNKV